MTAAMPARETRMDAPEGRTIKSILNCAVGLMAFFQAAAKAAFDTRSGPYSTVRTTVLECDKAPDVAVMVTV
jgi:hypothetical protein